ncbi:chemotaxis protein CheR [Sphingomonas sp. Leaf17]|uniref:CheR family methyltransferase n=1 Tax=Sphingomonas sp. Leaf17 TaxID=1735683 RepID=UPI0006F3E94A|nr:protein-glutamate O-methyltransferase CheR [Sphingomonas sp. Leaf17]KQM65663.1 chemotaxis protein CheR [Sphingomonas sp. Leaf17]
MLNAGSGANGVLAALLAARTGQRLDANRAWRLDTTLKPILRERGLADLDGLVSLLLEGNDRGVGDQIVDALLNQETSFFREAPIFDTLLDALKVVEAEGRRPRIWSAGCSTGQEPLSLAMLLAERRDETGVAMPEIVATDVSEVALARGRSGRFTQFEIQRGLPIRRMMRWFDGDGDEWVAKPDLVASVTFRRMNLVADRPPPGPFDIVLCRNVLFYLDPVLRAAVFERLASVLRPGGLLVLGAGETVIGQTPAFEPSRRYRGMYEAVGGAVGDGGAARRATG